MVLSCSIMVKRNVSLGFGDVLLCHTYFRVKYQRTSATENGVRPPRDFPSLSNSGNPRDTYSFDRTGTAYLQATGRARGAVCHMTLPSRHVI